MSSPPLPATGLIWTDDGAPRSARFGDVYFSADDGLAESRAVFLQGCGLPEAWAGRDRFTVAELGFGTGLNIVALLDLWRRTRPMGGHLHIVSVEAFPLSVNEAARALGRWPEIAATAAVLLAGWPRGTPGFHRIDLPGLDATIDLIIGEVDQALTQWSGRADAWFLDGFSPALNPDMWSPEVIALIAQRSVPDARLATFTVAGGVRRGLAEQGFVVEKRPGHGRKRERLEARLPGPVAAFASAPSVVVIGAGIAGASVARALTATGVDVTLIEAEAPGAGASGFPAALVTPRLDAGDEAIAGLHAQALERARDLYRAVPGAILAEGVLQLEQAARDTARFARIAVQPLWTEGEMTTVDPAEAARRIGALSEVGGLAMAGALAIRPSAVLETWLADTTRETARAERLEPNPTGWRVLDGDGGLIVEADVVVVTAGWGAGRMLPDLGLRPARGQADWVEGVAAPAMAWGGYVAPTATGLLYGATHDRDDVETDVRAADSARNLATLTARLPAVAAAVADAPRAARAAIRATTPDRLPACGAVPGQPGLYVLSGLGSRGFCVAPLLGEHLAATITGTPSPLPADLAHRLRPDRRVADGPLRWGEFR